jgi:hypothetical protein
LIGALFTEDFLKKLGAEITLYPKHNTLIIALIEGAVGRIGTVLPLSYE